MAEAQRPRVFINEALQQLAPSGNSPVVLGLIGASTGGDTTKFLEFTSYSEVEAEYGANTGRGQLLVELARKAFGAGAATVRCMSIGTATLPQAATTLSAAVAAGDTSISVTSATGLSIGNTIYIGTYAAGFKYEEMRVISGVSGTTISFATALQFAHASGEAVAEVTPKTASDYTAAFAALETDRKIQIVVVDSDVTAVNTALMTAITNAAAKQNIMVAVRGWARGTSASTAISENGTANNDRLIGVWPTVTDLVGKYLTGAEGAAMVAGAVIGRGLPGANMNLLELPEATGVEVPVADFDALFNGGVSAIELQDGVVRVTRLVTSSITLNGVASDLLEEASVRLNVDQLERTIQRTLEKKFLTSGNTLDTRIAIQGEVSKILAAYNNAGILAQDETTGTPGYKAPIVATDSANRKQVNVDIEIAPSMPLVFIKLNFKINI